MASIRPSAFRVLLQARIPPVIRYQARFANTEAAPTIKVTSVPAPHCGSIKILSLNRPSARNAISRQLLAELTRHVNEVNSEGQKAHATRALIVASEIDASFCAGADLKERAGFTPLETTAFLSQLRTTFAALSNLPIPTISAVSSLAFGGGLELALTSTFRVFASNAIVALPETRLGILPGAGGTYRLPRVIGPTRARDMILTGRRVEGPEAFYLGLCDRLVEIKRDELPREAPGVAREKVLAEAINMARDICEGGPIAIQEAMKAVDGWQQGEYAENMAYDVVVQTRDRDEALLAFREKRKPVFKGR